MQGPRFHWTKSLLCAPTIAIAMALFGLLMVQLTPVVALEEPVPFSTSSVPGAIARPNSSHVMTIGIAASLIGGPDFLGWLMANAAGGISTGDTT